MKRILGRLFRWATEDRNYYGVDQVACPEITLDGIDQELYAKLLAEATQAGAVFSGSTASLHGADFDWNYDADAQTLHATCTKKPFYIGCGIIEQTIHDLVDKAKGGI